MAQKPVRQIYVDAPLVEGQEVALPKEVYRRLVKVLRMKSGAMFGLFNGKDGLLEAVMPDNKVNLVKICSKIKIYTPSSSFTLMVGLPKKEAFDRILRQATELGVTHIQPILTEFSVPKKLNDTRCRTLLVEAAEQCERLDIPVLSTPIVLEEALKKCAQHVVWCYERGEERLKIKPQDAALLVGPEGGFSDNEIALLLKNKHVTPITLGQTILRVDTAVVAGLSLLRLSSPAF